MGKKYLRQNVYEALLERLQFIFREFENIYISLSGGKGNGLFLNLILDSKEKYYPDRRTEVFHQGSEARRTVATQYIERTSERIKGEVELYWVCLSMVTRTALGSYEMHRYPWNDTKKEQWVRRMSDKGYVISLDHNPIIAYRYRVHQGNLTKQFGR